MPPLCTFPPQFVPPLQGRGLPPLTAPSAGAAAGAGSLPAVSRPFKLPAFSRKPAAAASGDSSAQTAPQAVTPNPGGGAAQCSFSSCDTGEEGGASGLEQPSAAAASATPKPVPGLKLPELRAKKLPALQVAERAGTPTTVHLPPAVAAAPLALGAAPTAAPAQEVQQEAGAAATPPTAEVPAAEAATAPAAAAAPKSWVVKRLPVDPPESLLPRPPVPSLPSAAQLLGTLEEGRINVATC